VTKNGIRGFAAGILVAAAVFAFFYYLIFNEGESQSAKVVKQTPLTEATVTQYLTNHHRKAIDIDAWNQWQADMKTATSKNNQSDKNNNSSDKNSKAKPDVKSYKLNIKSGMTPGDISGSLVSAKVINSDKKKALDKYLQDKKLEKYVQLGTFTVSSDMSVEKIAQVITKNHQN
jgi:hypothetical protein